MHHGTILRFCLMSMFALMAMTVLFGTARAEDFSGDWQGSCTYYSMNMYGERSYKYTGTCTLKISQGGDTVSDGVVDIHITSRHGLPTSNGGYVALPDFNSQIRSGSVKGSTITFRTLHEDWTFTKDGDKLVGGCVNTDDYSYLGIESDSKDFTLTFAGGFTAASIPLAGIAIAAAVAGLGVSFLPAPKVPVAAQPFNPQAGPGADRHYPPPTPTFPGQSHAYPPQSNIPPGQTPIGPQYQQGSPSGTTEVPLGPPVAGTMTGGVGLTYPVLRDPNGIPFPPKRYQSQYPPTCPYHPDIPCQAMFPFQNQLEPGSWFCPKCKLTPNEGYPWGKNIQ